ncbi:quinone-dependent dihydroorotate dehydrogenase [Alicyclobacillus dauci]|uniref:Dihydroorotate dehydrogenase (quinone) n=1 Tax=Alicyclobacillus dauci TaxID=1475485 RepID=A0ABY6YYX0_9BACL|nr:quinone-dependent dihydroorotate dehydrogenase [Alicyclobacillus dauci]WAH35828.1 quinone-dependent dihydroorotate dehydrogenase [Alicyclobacillus dauci]
MYRLARALLFQLDPEQAHRVVMGNLSRWPRLAKLAAPKLHIPDSLKQTVLGMNFSHPIGLAAGLDKDAIAVNGLFGCGFSSIEVGTVTPLPQPGNPTPRLFRLKPDEALINRMGFNNEGSAACAGRLQALNNRPGIIGVNIGKNKVTPNETASDDYEKALKMVAHCADYITVNLSSPNTPGLRDLQSASTIIQLLTRLAPTLDAFERPVFIKLSPDLSDSALTHISETIADSSLVGRVGIIATNTTISRQGLKSPEKRESGGLSGLPLQSRSTEVVRIVYRASEGKIPIVGCGGIFNADDAYEKIRAGASLLQIYTAFIYRGPAVVSEIVTGLANKLKEDGFTTISEAVGSEVR